VGAGAGMGVQIVEVAMAEKVEVEDVIPTIPEDETVLEGVGIKAKEVLALILETKLVLDIEDETLDGRADVVDISSGADDVAGISRPTELKEPKVLLVNGDRVSFVEELALAWIR